ncbi:uncharacterized protein N7506_011815 [Penicillium brevicompactum]|uniref:uncharacterized protein n=1 Tax=Penicillium brevicompactum TaxID=5074 RepID=UPI002541D23E|nr:uncharacterized protein N7506_011815 [Penicillium brevicompactum]KAJ5319111.1 hypothetical protein N7506_011815 [Penicillium brevicompactum]
MLGREIASKEFAAVFQGVSVPTISVDSSFVADLPPLDHFLDSLPATDLERIAFVIFTSGSTGRPKGCVSPHRSLAALVNQAPAFRMSESTRVLQFAPTIFAASSIDMYLPLLVGATVCIPSQHDLMNKLEEAMNRFEVTFACMTPSAAGNVSPTQVPGLETLCLVGEPLFDAIRKKWEKFVTLLSGYGLSEGVGIACISALKPSTHSRNIGVPPVAHIWLAEPLNLQRLAPVGSIGEIIIQGPNVNNGYLDDSKKTSAVFVKPPQWSSAFSFESSSPWMVRPGDLARYQSDGSLLYVGRKDTQVKIRGKRVEIGEVEGAIRPHLISDEVVIVEAAFPRDMENTPVLVGFLYVPTHQKSPTTPCPLLRQPDTFFQTQITHLDVEVRACLPEWMSPAVYMPLAEIPKTASGKTDRCALRQLISEMTWQQMEAYMRKGDVPQVRPRSDIEVALHGLFAQALNRDGESFGIHENFLRLGGDSIKAIALVQLCKRVDMSLTLGDIIEYGTVAQLTQVAGLVSHEITDDGKLEKIPTTAIQEQLEALCVVPDDVEEVNLCSPMQEGILLSQLKNPRQYAIRVLYTPQLSKATPTLDIGRLCNAWSRLLERHAMLRTIFVTNISSHLSAVQAQLKTGSALRVCHHEDDMDAQDLFSQHQSPRAPSALPQLSLHTTPSGQPKLEIEISHAATDGLSMSIIARDLAMFYSGCDMNPSQFRFADYVEYQKATHNSESLLYWENYLQGLDSSQFPTDKDGLCPESGPMPVHHRYSAVAADVGPTEIYSSLTRDTGITLATVVKLAWSLVLRTICRTDDVCFGYLTAARDAPVKDVVDGIGPLVNLMICRQQFDPSLTVEVALQSIQSDFVKSLPHRNVSLGDIRRSLGLERDDPMFNTCITQLPVPSDNTMEHSIMSLQELERIDPTEFDIGVEILVKESEIISSVKADTGVISVERMRLVAGLFGHAMKTIGTDLHCEVGNLDLIPDRDFTLIKQWHSHIPQPVERCVHDVIQAQCQFQPTAPAVCAWDGDWCYQELDRLSSFLSQKLRSQGVGVQSFVPVLMEKSRWVPIALLAILKAGGAFVLLDPSQPVDRLKGICADLGHPLIVASSEHQETAASIVGNVVVASDDQSSDVAPNSMDAYHGVEIGPRDVAYVVFTSGSTGKPKGVIIEHRSLCTTAAAMERHSPMNRNTRMYQYASHAFDVSVLDLMVCLMNGGCLCIPSAFDKQNRLLESLNELQANFVAFTPTVIRTLQPERLAYLKTLNVGGEVLTVSDVQRWKTAAPHIKIINMYGPAECTINVTVSADVNIQSPSSSIGHSMCNSLAWVVDPTNHEILLPVGAVGELLIQGPVVARGYLNRPDQTAKSFISPPRWLSRFMSVIPNQKLYKTGDLVQYAPCGSLLYKGRKDFQVKLRGQRFELSEVEEHLRRVFPAAPDVIAEVADLPQRKAKALVAFIHQEEWGTDQNTHTTSKSNYEDTGLGLLHPPCQAFHRAVDEAKMALAGVLPTYMEPTIYLPLAWIPRSRSGKTDRGQLRQLITAGLHEKWQAKSHILTPKQKPQNEVEFLLCSSVAQVIGLPEVQNTHENFFRLGGDSVSAMILVGILREKGYQLTVGHVFEHPRLDILATKMYRSNSPSSANVPKPFTLLKNHSECHQKIVQQAINQCGVTKDDIDDIYPCSPLQHSFFLYSTTKRGTLIGQFAYNLRSETNLDTLRTSWDMVSEAHPQLRTRIIHVEGEEQLHQVVLRQGAQLEYHEPPDEQTPTYLSDLSIQAVAGQPLLRIALVRRPSSTDHRLVISLQHSLYDGWSLVSLMSELERAYSGISLQHLPVTPFIRYLGQNDGVAKAFWIEELKDLRASIFPQLPSPTHKPHPSTLLSRTVTTPNIHSAQVTLSTKIQWSWAQVISHYTNNHEVAIGLGTAGRGTPVSGIEKIVAPTLAIFPYRLRIDPNETVIDALHGAQRHYSQILPHEHYGNPNICGLATGPTSAAALQTLLIVQPQGPESPSSLYSEQELLPQSGAFHVRALTLHCHLQQDSVEILACYDNAVISEESILRSIALFEVVFRQVCQQPDLLVKDLVMTLKNDLG